MRSGWAGLAAGLIGAGLLAGCAMADPPTGTPQGWGPGAMSGFGPGGMGPGMMGMGRRATFNAPAHIDALRTELAITSDQGSAWDAYAKTLQETAASALAERQNMGPGMMRQMSPQDRQAFMTQRMDGHQKRFDTLKAAAERLLPVLSDFQKGKANEILPGLAAFGPGMAWNGATRRP